VSGWIYCGTLPSIEDKSRYTAPPDITGDDEDDDLSPYDQGFQDRHDCKPRTAPRYHWPISREIWRKGWDAADEQLKEGEL
jgi:hypothetical protein